MTLVDKVRSTIKEHAMFEPPSTIVVAVSGGPDSVCLLSILNQLRPGELHVAHLNHSLRPGESDEDERFVRNLADSLHLPITVERVPPGVLSRGSEASPENAARSLRYRFLEKTASDLGARHIATGHTRDDQAETIIQRIVQGTGLRGLRGILPKRSISPDSSICINRPLIDTSRAEIENFLSSQKIAFRIDSTNFENKCRRNRIRNHLLPMLEEDYNPLAKEALARLAAVARQSYACLKNLAEEKLLLSQIPSSSESRRCALSIPSLLSEHPAIQMLMLESVIERLIGKLPRLTFEHFQCMLSLIRAGASGDIVSLPRGLVARKEHDLLTISMTERSQPTCQATLNIPGETVLPAFSIACRSRTIEGGLEILSQLTTEVLDFTAILDYDKIKLPLTVRFPKPGDSFQPLGMSGRKKLQDFFVDEKVPVGERRLVPLVVMDGEPIWVVGYRISEKVKVSFSTKRTLLIEIEKLPGY